MAQLHEKGRNNGEHRDDCETFRAFYFPQASLQAPLLCLLLLLGGRASKNAAANASTKNEVIDATLLAVLFIVVLFTAVTIAGVVTQATLS